ncbi:helix-turn-helix domain-containing protein [Paenibacillus methanolicus]|uniref:Two-component system response regulator YesN n=1 Tax=Paenibacillus methanolicus TaxID=582686 RepID=A0A5S5CDM1_9BACL|nr:helix-turn-helix domain-containing protein [Paenibacillus methanolicus]TYP76450.1 two-component system response regulator YesN [Paenibacillus methanolicus]
MIRAIVVDDEKLVRKGFISMIEWERYGIVIAGEAADAKSALALLAAVPVDLMFTDITMPGQSGFELIKQARLQYPRLQAVVLTCHHEFDYVQEALRLGAIDYIVKTLFELDNTDEVMNRIVERFRWELESRKGEEAKEEGSPSADAAVVFVPESEEADGKELYRLPMIQRGPRPMQAGRYWFVPLPEPLHRTEWQQEADKLQGWSAAFVTGLTGRTAAEIERALADGMDAALFYADGGLHAMRTIRYEALTEMETKSGAAPFRIGDRLTWMLSSREFRSLAQRIESERPSPATLTSEAEMLLREWQGLLLAPGEADELAAQMRSLRSWADWQPWLRRFADCAQRRMVELSLSKEVMQCLIGAVQLMRAEAGSRINQHEVAARVGMSRSYFSQCFARFAGESFGEVLRGMRIERAKKLLLETEEPIYAVASLAGFDDDKYFSRLFRDRVGMLPTDFRTSGGKTV